MDNTQSLDPDVSATIEEWSPRLFSAAELPDVADELRRLVAAAKPISRRDANQMLASASHLVAAVHRWGEPVELDVWLTEQGVNRWEYRVLAEGARPSSTEVRRGRLARLVRVRRGLPARMRVMRPTPKVPVGLFDWETAVVELNKAGHEGLLATLIAAVGAGLPARPAVGATITRVDEAWMVVAADGRRHPVTAVFAPYAARLEGATVRATGWEQARRRWPSLTALSARGTFCDLVVQVGVGFADLRTVWGLTTREMDAVTARRADVQLGDDYRLLLR